MWAEVGIQWLGPVEDRIRRMLAEFPTIDIFFIDASGGAPGDMPVAGSDKKAAGEGRREPEKNGILKLGPAEDPRGRTSMSGNFNRQEGGPRGILQPFPA